MPEMPMMPGLSSNTATATAGNVEDLAALLDSIDPLDFADLEAEAEAWIESTEPAEGETTDEELEEAAEDPEEETDEPLEEEAGEGEGEQTAELEVGTEDFDALRTQLDAAKGEAENQNFMLLEAIDAARDQVGVDGDALDTLEEEAAALMTEIEELAEEASDAIDDEDATEAAKLGEEIAKKGYEIHMKAERVTQLAGDSAPPLEETPILLAWADKYRTA